MFQRVKEFFGSKKSLTRTIKKNLRDPHGIIMNIGKGNVPIDCVDFAIQWKVDPSYTHVLLHEFINDGIHRVKGTWEDALEILMIEDIDTVFLIDVIRFFDKEESKDLLCLTKELVNNQVVVVTPVTEALGQKSVWSFKDFQKKGWQIWMFDKWMLAIYTVKGGE